MSEDTLRETPVAKASDSKIKVEAGEWKAPHAPSTELAPPGAFEPREFLADSPAADRPGGSARVDIGFGNARVHTFEARGPFAYLLAIVVLLAVAAIVAMVFVFAVGAGAALAAGAAVAAALGMGAAKISRLLAGKSRSELDERRREP